MSWNGYCEKCEVNTRSYWCKACNAKRFQQNFKNWTSGNNDIDKFIQDTQLSATHWSEVLEWIPYNKFYDIEYIAKGGFGKVYRAKWIDGQIERWDNENQNWRRLDSNMFVALKRLTYETHSEAVYTSRLLNFNNLPEPKNSDDYYEKNDNIISEKFSEFLQINISHLKISDAGRLEHLLRVQKIVIINGDIINMKWSENSIICVSCSIGIQ
ncbi:hypothetical protein GLOIN_2v1470566 [Rhizophagus irregularis DAOM 181602=DAOM 197198]|uniref:Protein kinase domain-containing protein n=1 Tax=Rhizophagus irregularis (strain DAOM 181602 / DAOM 197198 / MUCL 43194) TaxID=747089 RepID=A0A2P4QVR9_RHIID|nr:hypothetical protein GLOIN_2v1470566 [Rhizophagus irregularis DAOM 181602=DAOM 197198]POG81741.1 hypothetical protein GLOIN_2v1470566 [Rhizophagus irregularis DAOM 181602=DAOM 197198]|eukprot:XP_025188607.1 hypothetical protein GLOIN_2v1470566 [Rhizophagus irregularis DAOM 181602=DAOM 197198]